MQRYHFLKKDEGVEIPEGASMPSPSIPHAVPADIQLTRRWGKKNPEKSFTSILSFRTLAHRTRVMGGCVIWVWWVPR